MSSGKEKSAVTKDWKDYLFRHLELSDIPKILDYLTEHFYTEESIAKLLNPPDDKYPAFMNPRMAKMLEREDVRRLSFLAIHKPSGQIAGCQFQFKWTKEEALLGATVNEAPEDIPRLRRIQNLVYAPLQKTKLEMFSKYNTDYVIWNFLASVATNFRRQGLASEMYRTMVKMLRAESIPLSFSVFTSPYSRKCAAKSGFVEIDKVLYNTVRDEKGNLLFPEVSNEDYASIMVLHLN